MLKYKININNNSEDVFTEIGYSDLYIADDLSCISGITYPSYHLYDGQDVYVNYGDDKMQQYKLYLSSVTMQGYVDYEKTYPLEDVKGSDEIKRKGLKYKGVYYVSENIVTSDTENISSVTDEASSITIANHPLIKITSTSNTITLTERAYVFDGVININDVEYEVNLDAISVDNFDYTSSKTYSVGYNGQITIYDSNGQMYLVHNAVPSEWKEIQIFLLRKNSDIIFDLESVSSTKEVFYFGYTDYSHPNHLTTTHYLSRKGYSKKDENYYPIIIEKYNGENVYFKKNFYEVIECNENGGSLIDGEVIPLNKAYVENSRGEYITFNLSNQAQAPLEGQPIIAKERSISDSTLWVAYDEIAEKDYVSFCCEKYYLNEGKHEYVVIDGKEFLIRQSKEEDNNNKFFFIQLENGSTITLERSGDTAITVGSESYFSNEKKNSYPIIERDTVTINNHTYDIFESTRYIPSSDSITTKFCTVHERRIYHLVVTDVKNYNAVTCTLLGNEDDILEGLSELQTNWKRYEIGIENNLVDPSTIALENAILATYNYAIPFSFHLFNRNQYLVLPITLGNEMGLSPQQEDIVTHEFAEAEIQKRLNRIVDMEKDVYSPMKYVEDENSYTPIKEIKFHMHFRSRDENGVVKEGTRDNTSGCTWNVFDAVTYSSEASPFTKIPNAATSNSNYYFPSDLLGFLNFTDDDVFYQKSKLAKSFLRLSFFSSRNPKNQDLLYTATAFVDEGNLFNKYINNSQGERNANWFNVTNSKIKTKYINVFSEYNRGETTTIVEDDKRLDLTFSLKSRYESSESCEGYYIHMFKEQSTFLVPRIIYMKVEFAHAGTGKIYTFFQPKTTVDTVFSSFTPTQTSAIYEQYKKGIGLREIYDTIYIPIRLCYDKATNQYVYSLPSNANELIDSENVLHFNMFELKIKDES